MLKFNKDSSVVFCKTKDKYGGLSNMCAGYPIEVNGLTFKTSEALYQTLRFPNNPEVQRKILSAKSPIAAKIVCREFIEFERSNWYDIRIYVMRWCLRAKLISNWDKFGELLESTGNLHIVELSYKDNFWGAKPTGEYFEGWNILGRLLSELREDYRKVDGRTQCRLKPLDIPDFMLMGEKVNEVNVMM